MNPCQVHGLEVTKPAEHKVALYDKKQRFVGEDENAPDTYNEKNVNVTPAEIREFVDSLIGTKKAAAVAAVKEFTANAKVENMDGLNPEQLKTLRRELQKFRK